MIPPKGGGVAPGINEDDGTAYCHVNAGILGSDTPTMEPWKTTRRFPYLAFGFRLEWADDFGHVHKL